MRGKIRQIDFSKEKYSEQFLIDVGRIESLKGYVRDDTPHKLSFYDITFIQSGSSEFYLDDELIHLRPGMVIFNSPYQVRVWKSVKDLKGIALFFERDFVNMLFNDSYFLDRFEFFDNPVSVSHISLGSDYFNTMVKILEEMELEFQANQVDSNEILASNLYKILTSLNREVRKYQHDFSGHVNAYIHEFRQLLENKFKMEHKVNYYAGQLSITPAYLNDLCRKHVGISASQIIRDRLSQEAKRLILYSGLSIKEITYVLNFSNTANFSRFFKNNVGCNPASYHEHSAKRQFYPQNR